MPFSWSVAWPRFGNLLIQSRQPASGRPRRLARDLWDPALAIAYHSPAARGHPSLRIQRCGPYVLAAFENRYGNRRRDIPLVGDLLVLCTVIFGNATIGLSGWGFGLGADAGGSSRSSARERRK